MVGRVLMHRNGGDSDGSGRSDRCHHRRGASGCQVEVIVENKTCTERYQ